MYISVTTVAPTMMITSPAAASGVSSGRIRVTPGTIRPNAPSTPHAPMNRKSSPGIGIWASISSTRRIRFILPAQR